MSILIVIYKHIMDKNVSNFRHLKDPKICASICAAVLIFFINQNKQENSCKMKIENDVEWKMPNG
jgi:hypothetical protein